MNIYRISQSDNNNYDTFDSAVVIAESVESARLVHPILSWNVGPWDSTAWASSPELVNVKLIGIASPGSEANSVIVASYNAG